MTEYIYGQTQITGELRQRAHTITISNPREGTPSIIYNEERIAEIGGQVMQLPIPIPEGQRNPIARLLGGTVDLAGMIALRDFETGELTGNTVPIALIYQALYSDYLNRAFERDQNL